MSKTKTQPTATPPVAPTQPPAAPTEPTKEAAKPKKQLNPIDQEKFNKAMCIAQELMEQSVVELIFNEPFYANLIMNMRREFTVDLPTLGVNVTDQVNLFINPYFFNAMTLPERVDVLKHEAHHVLNNHFVRFRDIEPQVFENKEKTIGERIMDMQKASLTNQAADFAINEFLHNLPRKVKMFDQNGNVACNPTEIDDGKGNKVPNPDKNAGKPIEADLCFVANLKKKFPDIKEKQNMEYYYEYIKENQDKNNQNGQGQGMVLDDHSLWHESDQTEDDITQKVKDIVNKAVEQTQDKDMGKMSGDILAAIQKLNHVPKDWRQDIQRFVARSAEMIVENTRKRRNRRYGILHAGTRTYPQLHIAIGIDTSGSVGDEEVAQFFAEIGRLHNMNVTLTIIECDTQVNNVYKFDPKKPFQVKGRGGTAFKPIFDRIEKDKMDIDGLIYFTDGECWGEQIEKPRYPVLWALTPPFKLQGINFGAQTKVEVKKKVSR
jgi:predicted metal-dependent peptidase